MRIRLITMMQILMRILFFFFFFFFFVFLNADADPDPTFHPDADPDADSLLYYSIHFDADANPDADPGYPNDADPYPQHCYQVFKLGVPYDFRILSQFPFSGLNVSFYVNSRLIYLVRQSLLMWMSTDLNCIYKDFHKKLSVCFHGRKTKKKHNFQISTNNFVIINFDTWKFGHNLEL